jgi:hypothetical protein
MTDGVSVSLVAINVWRLAGDTLNITFNFMYCNHQVHRNFLITLYFAAEVWNLAKWRCLKAMSRVTEGLTVMFSYRIFHRTLIAIFKFGMNVTGGDVEHTGRV